MPNLPRGKGSTTAPKGGSSGTTVYGPQSMGVWAADILANLGAPHSQNNVNNLAAWNACESAASPSSCGYALNYSNPFNSEQYGAARTGYVCNSTQVPTYANYNSGLWSTLMTLRMPVFAPIVSALRRDASRQEFAAAVGDTGWGTSAACIASSPASAGIVAGTGLRPTGPVTGTGKAGSTGGATGTTTSDSSGSGAGIPGCLIGSHGVKLFVVAGPTVGSGCLLSTSQARAVLGVALGVSGAIVSLIGLVILAAAGFRRAAPAAERTAGLLERTPGGQGAAAALRGSVQAVQVTQGP
jgi:hypothetical protein